MTTITQIRELVNKVRTEGVAQAAAEMDKLGAAELRAAAGAEKVETTTTRVGRSAISAAAVIAKLERSLDPAAKATDRLERGLSTVSRALDQNSITAERAAAITARLNMQHQIAIKMANDNERAMRSSATAIGLNAFELKNLGFQLNDAATMLASGSSPFQVMATQGGQVLQVLQGANGGISGALKDITGRLGSMATVGRLAGGAVAAAGLVAYSAWSAFDDRQRAMAKSLEGVGRASGMTLGGLRGAAKSVASAGDISISNASGAVGALAGAGIDGSLIPGIGATAGKYAKLTGQSVADASNELAKAFSDPARGAEDLNKKLGFLDAGTRNLITTLQSQGNILGAQTLLLDKYANSVAKSADHSGRLAQIWERIKNSASNTVDSVVGAVDKALTTSPEQALKEQMGKYGRSARNYNPLNIFAPAPDSKPLMSAWQAAMEEVSKTLRVGIEKQEIDARNKSLAAMDIAKGALPNQFGALSRQNQITNLRDALDLPDVVTALGDQAPIARKALEELVDGPLKRMREDSGFAVSSILARTQAERTAIEAEKARTDAIRNGATLIEQSAAAEGVRSRAMAESTKAIRDYMRDAKDEASMFGLRPAQRRQREIEIRQRNFLEQNGAAFTGIPAGGGLSSDFNARLSQLMAAVPGLSIGSGFRTNTQQAALYAAKPGLAAPPGHSNHEFGLAADLQFASPEAKALAHAKAAEFGLRFPMGHEPWHVEPVGARAMRLSMSGKATATRDFSGQQAAAAREDTFGLGSPIGQAQDQLKMQTDAFNAQRAAANLSTEAIAAAAEKQRLLNEYWQAGINVTPELRSKIEDLAAGYGKLAKDQEVAQKSIQASDAIREESTSLFSGIGRAIGDRKSPGAAFREWGHNLGGKLIDQGAGMLTQGLFGKVGTAMMSVQAGMVNVNGGIGGALGGGGGGGILSSLFGGIFGGGGKGAITGGGETYGPFLPTFADGGVMTSRGRVPLRTYADGGIAHTPQMALFGEGSGPEAFVPLKSGHIPVRIANGGAKGGGNTYHIGGPTIMVQGDVSERNIALIKQEVARGQQQTLAQVTRNLQGISADAQQKAM